MVVHRVSRASLQPRTILCETLRRPWAFAMLLAVNLIAPCVSVGSVFSAEPTTQGPSQAELDRADTDSINWLTDNKGYMGDRFSTLSEINPGNARELKEVCSFELGETGSFQNGLIVYDGVLYTTTGLSTIAIDGATCEKKWEFHYKPSYVLVSNSKGSAIAGGRVIRGTPDGHLISLDARTGALLWDQQIMDPERGEFATAAPLVWNNIVFMGKAGADRGIRGEMMAFDAADGRKIWSFNVIPSPGEKGSETWQNPASIEHGGGSLWTTFALDPDARLLLLPVGNPGPDFDNDSRPGTNLFTNSLVALDAYTGELKWWHQLVAPDDRDWDTAVTAAFDGADGSKLAMAAGKDGVAHIVDRTTGEMRAGVPLVTRYLNTTGPVPTGSGIRLCPIAAVQWNGPAYSPETKLMYMNGIDWCAQAIKGPTPVAKDGREYLGWANYYGTRDPIDEAFGLINAIDPLTGSLAWRVKTKSIPLGGVTATVSGLVITGTTDGEVLVLDAKTGRELQRSKVDGAIGGGVITYQAGGRQLIAVAAGDNNATYGTKGKNRIVVLGIPK